MKPKAISATNWQAPVDADFLIFSQDSNTPEKEVLACFWWEFARSSEEVHKAIEEEESGGSAWCWGNAANVLGTSAIAILAMIRGVYGKKLFPQTSWLQLVALDKKKIKGVSGPNAATLWMDQLDCSASLPFRAAACPVWVYKHELAPPTGAGPKFGDFLFNPRHLGGSPKAQGTTRTSFLATINWQFSDRQIIDSFEARLLKLRPAKYRKPTRAILATPTSLEVRVNPRKALGWLFVQRTKTAVHSWGEFGRLFADDFKRAFGGPMPTDQELIARRKKAERVINWFKTGRISSVS